MISWEQDFGYWKSVTTVPQPLLESSVGVSTARSIIACPYTSKKVKYRVQKYDEYKRQITTRIIDPSHPEVEIEDKTRPPVAITKDNIIMQSTCGSYE